MSRATWYQQGYDDAVNGLPSDAPRSRGHKSNIDYREGYEDGQHFLDNGYIECEEEDV